MKPLTDEVRSNMAMLLEKAEAGLAALPRFDYQHRAPYDAAIASLVRQLEAAGARIHDRPAWESARISFGGVASTSTAGTASAISNWCVAARKRLGMEQAA